MSEEKPAGRTDPEVPDEAGYVAPVVTLRRSVLVNGEQTKQIRFREPRGIDLEQFGSPVIVDWNKEPAEVRHDTVAMTRMIASLGEMTVKQVREMHPKDWVNCAWAITPFFTPD